MMSSVYIYSLSVFLCFCFSVVLTVPAYRYHENSNIKVKPYQDQVTIGKVREKLLDMENDLKNLDYKYRHHAESDGLEIEEPIPKKMKDLSESEIENLESVLSDSSSNNNGVPIDKDGLSFPNPLEKNPTRPNHVEFVTPTNNGRALPPGQIMGKFQEVPLDDHQLGGHIITSHNENKPVRQHGNFGSFPKDGKKRRLCRCRRVRSSR